MRVLIFNWKDLAHPRAGGAEVYTEQLARRWVRDGDEVTLFCAAVSGSPERETIRGVNVVRRGGRFSVYREARRFYETEGRGAFDLVVDEINTRPFHTPRFVNDVPIVALAHQVCREIWWYEMPLPIAVVGRFWLERRWLADYADTPVLTVSESSRTSLADYGLRNLTVVPEGISATPRPAVSKESVPTFIFVGRLSANKRPMAALKAFRRMRREQPDAQLWFVGEGPQQSKLQRRAGAGVTFFGRVDRATRDQLLARAHVLLCTSVREGWGLVVDEALAMGTPTVGYDVPGLRDSIPAAGGALVAPNSEALAIAALERLRSDTQLPTAGGAVSWDIVAAEVMKALRRGVDQCEPAAP